MCEPWHYLRLNVILYITPRLSILWRATGEEFLEVARLDIGNDSAICYGVVVIDNWTDVSILKKS